MDCDIVAEGLVKRYKGFEALKGVSFSVRRGEIFGFLGPNGAGKTTTLHILTTLIKPSAGKAFVAGHDVVREPNKVRREIGVVFQDPSLDEELTGYENLYIHGRLYGLSGAELKKRIDEALNFVELHEFKDRPVRTYSGGMRRRLEIARALLHAPRVLFLDEPTLGLDPHTRVHIWEYLKRLNRELGVTVFLTTHYMEEAEALCHRVAIIDRGKIVALGTVEELRSLVGPEVVYMRLEGAERQALCNELLGVVHLEGCREVGPELIALHVNRAPESLPEVLRAVEGLGIRVREVSYRRPTLNDVFLHLTGRELRDTGGGFIDFVRMVHRARMR